MLSPTSLTYKRHPLREIACFEQFSFKIYPRGKLRRYYYVSRIWPDVSLQPIGTSVGLRVRLVDVINCAKFYRNRLRGLNSVSGQSLTIPIELPCRRLHSVGLASVRLSTQVNTFDEET